MIPIYKLFYLAYRGSSGLWYWARRRFTLAGLCAAGAFLVAGMVGVDIENTVIYQSFSLLAAFLLLALATGIFFRCRFSATRTLPRCWRNRCHGTTCPSPGMPRRIGSPSPALTMTAPNLFSSLTGSDTAVLRRKSIAPSARTKATSVRTMFFGSRKPGMRFIMPPSWRPFSKTVTR